MVGGLRSRAIVDHQQDMSLSSDPMDVQRKNLEPTRKAAIKRFSSEAFDEASTPTPKRRKAVLEMPKEMPQHLAYIIAQRKNEIKLGKKLKSAIDAIDEKDKRSREVKRVLTEVFFQNESSIDNLLSPAQKQIIEEISEKQGNFASQMMCELILTLKEKNLIRTQNGAILITFAKDLIEKLPEKMSLGSDVSTDSSESELDLEEIPRPLQQLGALLFLIDKDQEFIFELFRSNQINVIPELLEREIRRRISSLKEQTENHKKAHEIAALQNSDEAYIFELGKSLSFAILLPSGGINIPLYPILNKIMIKDELREFVAMEEILNTLETILQSDALQETLRKAEAPKDDAIEMSFAIKTTLCLDQKTKLTSAHARHFILSGLLGHIRQGSAGTCFATSFMIKLWNEGLLLMIDDLTELVSHGKYTQTKYGYPKTIPYRALLTSEYLDTIITSDPFGQIINTESNIKKIFKQDAWKPPLRGAKLQDAPGIIAVCQALNLSNKEAAITDAIKTVGLRFDAKQLIYALAEIAFKEQQNLRVLRSNQVYTVDQLKSKGIFAFCAETNHPLVRGYEQALATGVDYFSSAEVMAHWAFDSFERSIKSVIKGRSREFVSKFHLLLAESFLPMITRMKFLYNPVMDDEAVLFPKDHHGTTDHSGYGYELVDSGLPEDFEYSKDLYQKLKKNASWMPIFRFHDYPPFKSWRVIRSGEEFTAFLKNVLEQTTLHLEKERGSEEGKVFNEVLNVIKRKIDTPSFIDEVSIGFFPHDKEHKNSYIKNPHLANTKPWKYYWGGSIAYVMKGFFGTKTPSKMIKFNGSPLKVLATTIDYLKKQPESIKEDYSASYHRIPITSPVHAFLLTPQEPSLLKAWQSPLETTAYIEETIINPLKSTIEAPITRRMALDLIDFVASQCWYSRGVEKHDFDRIQLTDESKAIFDGIYFQESESLPLEKDEFLKVVASWIFKARSEDPKIGRRNPFWERSFNAIFRRKLEEVLEGREEEAKLSLDEAHHLIAFARNMVDTKKISDEGIQRIKDSANFSLIGLTIPHFKQKLLDLAFNVYSKERGYKAPQWKEGLSTLLDNKIYSLMPREKQLLLSEVGIVAYDTNWKDGIHNIYFIYTVNPGTGQLELCRYIPDLKHLTFMSQKEWFPKGKEGARWNLPDNYREIGGFSKYHKDDSSDDD